MVSGYFPMPLVISTSSVGRVELFPPGLFGLWVFPPGPVRVLLPLPPSLSGLPGLKCTVPSLTPLSIWSIWSERSSHSLHLRRRWSAWSRRYDVFFTDAIIWSTATNVWSTCSGRYGVVSTSASVWTLGSESQGVSPASARIRQPAAPSAVG